MVVFMEFFKKGHSISKTIQRNLGEYAAAKGAKGVCTAADFEISWYCYPDKVRIFVPDHKKIYYYKITYAPYYASKKSEKAGIVSSYTHEYKLTYTKNV